MHRLSNTATRADDGVDDALQWDGLADRDDLVSQLMQLITSVNDEDTDTSGDPSP